MPQQFCNKNLQDSFSKTKSASIEAIRKRTRSFLQRGAHILRNRPWPAQEQRASSNKRIELWKPSITLHPERKVKHYSDQQSGVFEIQFDLSWKWTKYWNQQQCFCKTCVKQAYYIFKFLKSGAAKHVLSGGIHFPHPSLVMLPDMV